MAGLRKGIRAELMMPQRRIARIAGWVLIVLGLSVAGLSAVYWDGCVSPSSATCAEAIRSSSVTRNVWTYWIPAVVLAIVVLCTSTRKAGWRWAPIALVLVAFPAVDPGYFWSEWDVANAVPGNGVISGTLIAVGGVFAVLMGRAERQFSPPEPR